MATYQCEECDKILKKCNMKRHAQEVHGEGTSQLVYCDMCEYASNRQRDLERHTYKAHHTPVSGNRMGEQNEQLQTNRTQLARD